MHGLAAKGKGAELKASARQLGLSLEPTAQMKKNADDEVVMLVSNLLAERETARKQRDYARSDHIREELLAAGLDISDNPSGPSWTLGPAFDRSRLLAIKPNAETGGGDNADVSGSRLDSAGKSKKDREL